MPEMIEFKLDEEYIGLYILLKLTNVAESGGSAKHTISEGLVTVDGEVETRKACKIRKGQVIKVASETILVT
ncbi:RNA-binding S4 domain-containing protein [Candidatus Omnitrophota bacterium]